MTTIENPQRERTQHDQAAHANQAHAAEQRQDAAHVGHAVTAARAERMRARHLGADTRRLEDALQILDEQINGREDMGVLRPGNVLRYGPGAPEQGTANVAAICEFVARMRAGELPYDALEDMHEARLDMHLAPAARHAESLYQRAHRLEHAATVQAALPPAQPALNGAPLPRRVPGASGPQPSQPPMYPPAPPESPAQQTGQIIQALRDEGFEITPAQESAARKDHQAAPAFGPLPDPRFAASALPQTKLLPRIDDSTQVFSPFFGDDEAGAVADAAQEQDGRLVPPFAPAAVEAAGSPSGAASGSGDDGEA